MKRRGATLATASLAALLFLLPFEPRRPALPFFGLRVTLLEASALAVMAMLLVSGRKQLGPLLRRPPLPLALLAGYACAHLLSAWLAPAHRVAAAIFALRLVACALLAALVAATPRETQRRVLAAFVAGTLLLAVFVLLEGLGVGRLDPFLDLFREGPASGRASGASESPNLAATWLMQGLVTAAGLGATTPLSAALPVSGLLGLALRLTDSRGGLLSALAGLAVLAFVRRRRRQPLRVPVAACSMLIATCALPGSWFRQEPGALRPDRGFLDGRPPPAISLRPGGTRRMTIRVKNASALTWPGGTRLRAFWPAFQDGPEPLAAEAVLSEPVLPGTGAAPSVDLRVPETPGRYWLRWELSGAGDAAPLSLELAVRVEDRETYGRFEFWLPYAPGPRGRAELWRLALAMWRKHPVTGAGPDNFRRLHGAYGAFDKWRVFDSAHSLFLEAAATTGTLGLAALLTLLVATARAAWRGAATPGAAAALGTVCLALLAGIVVHGTVDFLLGFTGQYLLLGWLVGVASSLGAPEAAGD